MRFIAISGPSLWRPQIPFPFAPSLRLVLVCLFVSLTRGAQNALPPVQQPAPELELSQLLQAPVGTQPLLAAWRGRAVVLEFWATWCGGCVTAIPHLNDLAAQFQDKPIVFLSVTDEEPNVVQAFLRKRPMAGWIGIDKSGMTFQRYGIEGRPQTILINAQGVLEAVALPDQLNATVLDQLLAGIAISPNAKLDKPIIPPMELVHGAPPPLLQTLIRPAASVSVSGFSPGAVAQTDDGRTEYFGMHLRTLLAYAQKVREDRIIAPEWFDQNCYDLSLCVPKDRDQLRNSLLQQLLVDAFQLQTRRETRPVSVYVLRPTSGLTSKLQVSHTKQSPGFSSHPGQFTGVATPVSRLGLMLSRELSGVEVIDETGFGDLYDFDLSWQSGNGESLQNALYNQLGMTLRRETRNREFLIIVAATEPRTW